VGNSTTSNKGRKNSSDSGAAFKAGVTGGDALDKNTFNHDGGI